MKSDGGIKPEKEHSKAIDTVVDIEKKDEPFNNQLTKAKIDEKYESSDIKKEDTNESEDVKKEALTFEAEGFYASEKGKQSSGVKREFDEVKKFSDVDSLPVKKEKAAKKEEGQLSLLSYFGKK